MLSRAFIWLALQAEFVQVLPVCEAEHLEYNNLYVK